MALYVRFWGTRGSIPTPGSWTRIYGGNTPCVEIRTDDALFICDAGSGIRELGKDILHRKAVPSEIHLFLSHTHWDHIQGFPFFHPAYREETNMFVYGLTEGDDQNYRLLSGQMDSKFFPVDFTEIGTRVKPAHLNDGEGIIAGVSIKSVPLVHPGGCHAFIFEKDGTKIVYASDQEIVPADADVFPDPNNMGPLRTIPQNLKDAFSGADLLIVDAQYDDAEYLSKKGWGHMPAFTATDLGIQCGAKNVALFHHDPESTDAAIDALVSSCRQRALRHQSRTKIFAAREGIEFKYQKVEVS